MYDNLIKSNHKSMFRHESHYYIIPKKDFDNNIFCKILTNTPYVLCNEGLNNYYISTNKQFLLDNNLFTNIFNRYEVSEDVMINDEFGF